MYSNRLQEGKSPLPPPRGTTIIRGPPYNKKRTLYNKGKPLPARPSMGPFLLACLVAVLTAPVLQQESFTESRKAVGRPLMISTNYCRPQFNYIFATTRGPDTMDPPIISSRGFFLNSPNWSLILVCLCAAIPFRCKQQRKRKIRLRQLFINDVSSSLCTRYLENETERVRASNLPPRRGD